MGPITVNRISTESALVGTIDIEHSPAESAWQVWDDSTLEQVLASFAKCEASAAEPFSRIRHLMLAANHESIVRVNRTQLLRDLEAEYEKLCHLA